jgi:hypothetical protein
LRVTNSILKTTAGLSKSLVLATALFCVSLTDAAARGGGGRSQAAQSITVPLQFDGDFPVVMARVYGNRMPLMIDLGQAAPVALQQSAVDIAQPTSIDRKYGLSNTKGNVLEVLMFKVQRVEIAGETFSDVEGYIDSREPSAPPTTSTSQGAIGFTLLRSFKVIPDYKHKSMTLIHSSRSFSSNDNCRGASVPLLSEWHGLPVAKARTDLGEFVFVWNTGATRSVLRRRSAEDANATILDQRVSLQHLSLGDTDFGPTDLLVFDHAQLAGTDGFIGDDFFLNHVVCIDFPGKRLLVRS